MTPETTAEATIAEDLRRVDGLIARTYHEVDDGQPVDLSELDQAVQHLCGRISSLPQGQGRQHQSRLIALQDELGRLTEAMRLALGAMEESLSDGSKRRQAASAYGAQSPAKR